MKLFLRDPSLRRVAEFHDSLSSVTGVHTEFLKFEENIVAFGQASSNRAAPLVW
jgi:hypothetical protein